MEKQNKSRAFFSSKIGFVLAAASSAVGLGNLWRFPYIAAKYGGGAFLFIYILLAITFGFVLMVTEISLGRKTRQSAIGAFQKLDKRFGICGFLGAIIPAIITPYYCAIGGWVVKYIWVFISGDATKAATDSYFGGFISEVGEPIICLTIFILMVTVVVFAGVEKGIERAGVILMPLLILLSVIIAIYAVTRPGAGAGVAYFLKVDFANVNGKTILGALGQLFYSLSLAMGIMITYGSYMKKEDNIETSVIQIEFFDTLIAILAGLMIIPAVFVFSGGDASAVNSGPGLMFITLPKIFDSLPGGIIVGGAFFVLVLFAALTSAISLLETLVSIIMDKIGWSRSLATIIAALYTLSLGICSALGFSAWSDFHIIGMDILDFMDFVSNSIFMPVLALLICIFVGFFLKPKAIIEEVESSGHRFIGKGFYAFSIKWLVPIGIIAILISSIASSLGLFSY